MDKEMDEEALQCIGGFWRKNVVFGVELELPLSLHCSEELLASQPSFFPATADKLCVGSQKKRSR